MHMLIHDSIDRQLIAILRMDARAPVSSLASKLSVSRATAQKRLDRLIETGAILGFTIRAAEEPGNGQVRAVMMIEVAGKATVAVIRQLNGLTELRKLHSTNGKWDLVAEITAASLADFDRVLRMVRTIEGVTNSDTSILLSTI